MPSDDIDCSLMPLCGPNMLAGGSGGTGGPHTVRHKEHEVFFSSHRWMQPLQNTCLELHAVGSATLARCRGRRSLLCGPERLRRKLCFRGRRAHQSRLELGAACCCAAVCRAVMLLCYCATVPPLCRQDGAVNKLKIAARSSRAAGAGRRP